MRTLCALVLLLLAPAASPVALAQEPLRIGVQNDRPPFSFTGDDGELLGFDVEIAWALCAVLETRCELVPLEFAGLIPALQESRIDAAVASMTVTDERSQLVDFTGKYYQASNRFVARRGTLSEVTPASLAGKIIGVRRATTHDRYLTDQYAAAADIRRYGYADEIFIDLALGRLDLAFGDGITLTESFLKTDLGAGFELVGPNVDDPRWFGRGEGIAVRKGDAALLARLNAALREILSDGTYQEIRVKFFDYDIYGGTVSLAPSREPGGSVALR
jgi:arginine/ornithine transport system substrate-binding protein